MALTTTRPTYASENTKKLLDGFRDLVNQIDGIHPIDVINAGIAIIDRAIDWASNQNTAQNASLGLPRLSRGTPLFREACV
jgi:hypothetical protein